MSYDTMDFQLFDPIEAGEEWAIDIGSRHKVVRIILNGMDFLDIVRPIEQPYKKEEGLDLDGEDYGHISAADLYGDLKLATDPIYGDRVYLCCCGSCGEPGCWGITMQVKEEDDAIIWYDFEHEHRDWEYNLLFRFDKSEYNTALKRLSNMAAHSK